MKKMIFGLAVILLGIYLALMGYCYHWPFMYEGHILFIVLGFALMALGFIDDKSE